MKLNLAVIARLLFVSAAWTILSLAAPLHGAQPGFPFAEDFQSQSLLSTQTTARWTSSGVTLGRARHLHMRSRDFAPRHSDIGNSPATTAINDIAVRDMDGDGNMDVITAGAGGVFVYYIDKGADLESVEPVRIASASSFRAMAIGDFDRDGYLDVAAASNLREVVPFMNNKGDRGVFIERPRVSNLRVMALASADMDGDGDLDLVLAQSKGRIVEVHLNDGAGNFSENEDAVSFIAGHNGGLGVGDFNGDGDMDIALAKVGGMNLFYLNDGSGGFQDRRLLNHTGAATFYRGLALGDVNNDGHLDIVVGVRTAPNLLYLGDGNGGFSTGSRINNSASWTIDVELADLDGDGDLDLFEGVSRRGHRVYLNQDGVLDSEGLPVRGRTNAIAVGDADGDGHLGMVHGSNPAELKVARFSERQMSAPSASLFDTGRGRVVSGKVNGDEGVPHIVFLTATAVQQEHTDIEYYLSNNDGKRWIRAYPGKAARFSSAGNVLRWRAELKSRSPVKTATLTRVSIENVLQVFIGGEVFRNGQTFTATTHTIVAGFEPTTATIRLVNRGERALKITGFETVGAVFVSQDEDGNSLSQPLSIEIEEGDEHNNLRLAFDPVQRGIHASTLTISSSEGGDVLPDIKVALRGQGIGAEILVPDVRRVIDARVGTSKSQKVKITNKGEESLHVSTPTITNPEFSLINPTAFPVPVTADSSVEIEFRFEPDGRGTTTTDITFFSNAVNGIVTRTLTGKGIAPVISVQRPGTDTSVPEIDFGRVRVNRPTSLTRVIKNTGDLPLIVTAVTVENSRFKLLEPIIEEASSMTVPVRGTLALTLQFNPPRRATTEDTLIIHSDAFNAMQTTVTLAGIGTAPEIDFDKSQRFPVQFGDVRVGESDTRTVVIKNMGDEPLIVSGVISKTTAADVRGLFAWVPPFPEAASQTVAAEATATLTLRFTPRIRRDAPFTDTLMIDSDAVNMTEKFLTVEGAGIAPVMAIAVTNTGARKPGGSTASVSSHDFGDVPINTSTSREVFISNERGTAPLEVAVSLVGGRGFRWESTPGGVITVEGGESAADLEPAPNLVVHFRPQDREPDTARLIFRDTRNNLHTTYTLTGRGTGAEMELRMGGETLAAGTTHTFSATKVNTSRTVTVQVHNRGNVPMNISTPTLAKVGDLTGFSLVKSGGLPDTVPEEGFERFTFRFKPTARGTATALVTFTGDAVNATRTTIFLQGRGTAPMISVTPTGTIQFGDVRARTSTDRRVKITNTGDATLEVTSASVVNGGAAESLFSVVDPAQFPHPVGVGEELPLTVRFSPLEQTDRNVVGTLDIKSDAFHPLEKRPRVSGIGVVSTMAIVIAETNANANSVLADGHSILLHDFGNVPINTSASRRVFISNRRGKAPLRVEIPPLGEAGPFRWQNDPVPEVVAVEADKSTSGLILVFEPREIGPSSTTLTFRSNAFENADQTITLTGRGIGRPRMEVEIAGSVRRHDGAYSFSKQRVGTTESVAVTIRNTGNDDLRIESIATTSTGFQFLDRPASGILRIHPPLSERHELGYTLTATGVQTIPASGSSTVMLHFSPSLPSRKDNALLTIRSNDPDHPEWSLNLKGSGTGRLFRAIVLVFDDDGDHTAHYDITGGDFHVGSHVVNAPPPTGIPHQLGGRRAGAGSRFSLESGVALIRLHSMGDIPVTVESVSLDDDSTGFHRIDEWPLYTSSDGTWYQYQNVFFEPVHHGAHTATVVIESNDDTYPEIRIRLKADGIAPLIRARAGDFGDVPVGGSSVTEVVVSNSGDAPLTIKGVSVAGDGPFRAGIIPSEFPVVQPGLSSTFSVSFSPVKLGVSTAALILRSDALGEPEHRVVLRGNGIKPENTLGIEIGGQAMASQTSFNFGRVPVGRTTAVAVTISNRGASGLRLRPQAEGRGYSLADSAIKTVTQGVPGVWILRFRPESRSGTHRGSLTIVDVDNPLNSRIWGLTGFGHGPQIKVAVDGSAKNKGARHNFGSIGYGSSAASVVKITNEGNSALNIKSIRVTPAKPEYSAGYGWAYGSITWFANIAVDSGYNLVGNDIRAIPSSDSATLDLHFTPVMPVANDSVLTIVSDDPEHPEWNLNLTGRGTGPFLNVLTELPVSLIPNNGFLRDFTRFGRRGTFGLTVVNLGDSAWNKTSAPAIAGEGFGILRQLPNLGPGEGYRFADEGEKYFDHSMISLASPTRRGIHTGTYTIYSNDAINPEYTVNLEINVIERGIDVAMAGRAVTSTGEYHFGDVPVDDSSPTRVTIRNDGNAWALLKIEDVAVKGEDSGQFNVRTDSLAMYPVVVPSAEVGPDTWSFDLSFNPTTTGAASARLVIKSDAPGETTYVIRLRGNGISAPTAPSNWADGAQRAAIPTFTEIEPADVGAPRFVGLGYADKQSRLWLAFDEPAQILSGADARVLADGAVLSGFEVLPNYTGGDGVEDIGVLRARYRSGGVVMDIARNIVPADASVWVRYTPPSDGVSGIYDMAVPPNRISSARLFMLPRSAVLDYDGDGFPDALEARLGGNPLVADDVAGLPEVALLRAGVAGSPAAVAYSGIRADGVAAHLGVMTTGASSLAAYYLSDTFGYSGSYALGVDGYGCTNQFPADYALPVSEGGCAVVDFNSIRAGVEHRIGWLATNGAGYWAVAKSTTSRLPEQVILRVPEFNMKRRNVFVANSAAADATVVVGAFHDGPASLPPLTVSLSNVAAVDSPSSSQPDGFSMPVAGVTTDTTNYAITGVHSGEDSKLWLAGDPLSALTPDKYSLGKVTQTSVVRLADDNLPPLFGRASLYAGTTADENERHAVVVRGTESYIALLPVVQGSAQTASAFEVSPWDGAGGGEPVAADDRMIAVNTASPAADGALVRIAFTASNPPATVRNTVSLEVAASSAGASTATMVLTWPVIDSADALASIAGDNDNDGIPDVRDNYPLLNRLPISVAGGVSGYPDRSSAGTGSWHHIRPLLPLHNQFAGSYATRAGLSFHTGFVGDARILARFPVATSGGETFAALEGQSVLAAEYQPGAPVQMHYADFAASLSRDEFDAMAEQSRRDIAVVYNFRLHGVEPSVAQAAQGASLAGGRAGVVIPLPESLRETTNILPLHYTNGAWSGFSSESDAPATAGFAPLQAGACPDDSGVTGSAYRTENGALNTRKRTGDACMVLYLTDGAAADRDGNLNGVVDALIGLAATAPPR